LVSYGRLTSRVDTLLTALTAEQLSDEDDDDDDDDHRGSAAHK